MSRPFWCHLHPYEEAPDVTEPPGCAACEHLAVCDDPDNCEAPECVDNRTPGPPGGRR